MWSKRQMLLDTRLILISHELEGIAVECVVIFPGKVRRPLMETGLDLSVDVVVNMGNRDYFCNNDGFGKHFPGGPSFKYKGKPIPCVCQWSEKGGIITQILVAILSTLDTLYIFDVDRDNGGKPFLLVDGHRSRFELPFLRYICDKEHEGSSLLASPTVLRYGRWGTPRSRMDVSTWPQLTSKTIVEQKEMMLHPSSTIGVHDTMIIIANIWVR